MLLLVDARAGADALDADDQAILARLPPAMARVVVHNKADLARIAPDVRAARSTRALRAGTSGSRRTSAYRSAGIDLLERKCSPSSAREAATEDTFLARERHVDALREASVHLAAAAAQSASAPPPIELFAEELRDAQRALSAITGEFTADDLLGVIFGRFCIGK